MSNGHNHQLHSIVARIEQLEAAKADTTKAINHAYAAAKADGYDVRALRAVIRMRTWDAKAYADHEAKVDAYSDALFAFEHTPLGRAMSPPVVGQSAEDAKRAGGLTMIDQHYERLIGVALGLTLFVLLFWLLEVLLG